MTASRNSGRPDGSDDSSKSRIVEAAVSLFYSKGYDAASVADILDAVGIAKGTFYHHFSSKSEVVEEIVSRNLDQVEPTLREIADNPELSAPEKFRRLFSVSQAWKTRNRDVVIATMTAMYSNKNLLLRRRMEQESLKRVQPIYRAIIAAGVREGSFDPVHPHYAADFVFSLWLALGEDLARLFVGAREQPGLFDELQELIGAYQCAMERILGAPRGSLPIVNRDQLAEMRGENEIRKHDVDAGQEAN